MERSEEGRRSEAKAADERIRQWRINSEAEIAAVRVDLAEREAATIKQYKQMAEMALEQMRIERSRLHAQNVDELAVIQSQRVQYEEDMQRHCHELIAEQRQIAQRTIDEALKERQQTALNW